MHVNSCKLGCRTCRAADGLACVVDDHVEAREFGLDERAERLVERLFISFIEYFPHFWGFRVSGSGVHVPGFGFCVPRIGVRVQVFGSRAAGETSRAGKLSTPKVYRTSQLWIGLADYS